VSPMKLAGKLFEGKRGEGSGPGFMNFIPMATLTPHPTSIPGGEGGGGKKGTAGLDSFLRRSGRRKGEKKKEKRDADLTAIFFPLLSPR